MHEPNRRPLMYPSPPKLPAINVSPAIVTPNCRPSLPELPAIATPKLNISTAVPIAGGPAARSVTSRPIFHNSRIDPGNDAQVGGQSAMMQALPLPGGGASVPGGARANAPVSRAYAPASYNSNTEVCGRYPYPACH